jgi:hypothetical protein
MELVISFMLAEVAMRRIKEKITAMLNAMTFAEAGEHDAAIACMEQPDRTPSVPGSARLSPSEPVGTAEKGLLHRFGNEMAAAAFAEAGEFDTARALAATAKGPKAVLLIANGELVESAAFSHALNLCKRLDARLEIVALMPMTDGETDATPSPENQRFNEHLLIWSQAAEEHRVPCSVDVVPEGSDAGLMHHIRQHKGIAAVIDGSGRTSLGNDGSSRDRNFLESIAERLSVPLVKAMNKRIVGDNA